MQRDPAPPDLHPHEVEALLDGPSDWYARLAAVTERYADDLPPCGGSWPTWPGRHGTGVWRSRRRRTLAGADDRPG